MIYYDIIHLSKVDNHIIHNGSSHQPTPFYPWCVHLYIGIKFGIEGKLKGSIAFARKRKSCCSPRIAKGKAL